MSSTETASQRNQLDERIARYTKIGVPIATILVAIAVAITTGVHIAILVLAGGALVLVIATFWASIRTLLGEASLSGADAYALGAPRLEEEQKRAILRTLKDLEFEHGVGKISEEDYQELVTKYRAEAKRLLRLLDEEANPRRRRVEALLLERLRSEGLIDKTDHVPEAEHPAQATAPTERALSKKAKKLKKRAKHAAPAPRAQHDCSKCGTPNDADAVFCKKCGARQTSDSPSAQDSQDEAEAR